MVNSIGRRLALRQSDVMGYNNVGFRPQKGLNISPGRGFTGGTTPLEFQVALPMLMLDRKRGALDPMKDPILRREIIGNMLAGGKTTFLPREKDEEDELEKSILWMSSEDQNAQFEYLCMTILNNWQGRSVEGLELLPDYLRLADVPRGAIPSQKRTLPIGLKNRSLRPLEAKLEPLEMELQQRGGLWLVFGPSQSGKSTLLASLALGLAKANNKGSSKVAIIALSSSPLHELANMPGLISPIAKTPDEFDELIAKLDTELQRRELALSRQAPLDPLMILIDDATVIKQAILDGGAKLKKQLAAYPNYALDVVLAENTTVNPYGLFLDENIRKMVNAGVILRPNLVSDGAYMSVKLPKTMHRAFGPGRGFWVQGSDVQLVQVAIHKAAS